MQRDYWPTTEWQTALPDTVGMDSGRLIPIDAVIRSQYENLNGIIIVRKGYIVHEKYYHRKTPADTHNVASVTKSITSALIGIAIDKGYIKNADTQVLDYFPEYVCDTSDKRKQEITIRHLLTMTAPYPFANWHEPLDRMRRQSDWVRYALDMLGQGGRIGTFKYSTAGAHLLSAILTRTTGKCASDFANGTLFKPIGMKEIPYDDKQSCDFENVFGKGVKGWIHDPNGNSVGGMGLALTLRDMARFGFLYLNEGVWNGRQIISKAWINESISMNKNKYGYLWWLRQDSDTFAYMAMGSGGNVICCIPEKDLVIAIASRIISRPRDRWPLIEKHILPAVQK